MKIDLSDVRVGDTVFSILFGFVRVNQFSHRDKTIEVESCWYSINGTRFNPNEKNQNVILFHSAQEASDYFKWIAGMIKPKRKYYLNVLIFENSVMSNMEFINDQGELINGDLYMRDSQIKLVKIENVFIER